MDTTTISKFSREFLNSAEKNKKTVNVSYELPKSFIICNENGEKRVYISPLSSITLQKRIMLNKFVF